MSVVGGGGCLPWCKISQKDKLFHLHSFLTLPCVSPVPTVKNSDFLEQNPAMGESIFSLVGSEGGEEATAVEPGDGSRATVADNSCAGAESVEDLTRQLLMQLRSAPTVTVPKGGGDAAAKFLGVGAQGGGGAGAGGLEDMLQGLVDVTSVDENKHGDASGADRKLPGLGDALETLLGALGPGVCMHVRQYVPEE